jgi:hypothetical protein
VERQARSEYTRVVGFQPEDSTLFIIYKHQRYTLNHARKRAVDFVVTATFREADIRVGKPVTDKVRLRKVATQLQIEHTAAKSGAPGR